MGARAARGARVYVVWGRETWQRSIFAPCGGGVAQAAGYSDRRQALLLPPLERGTVPSRRSPSSEGHSASSHGYLEWPSATAHDELSGSRLVMSIQFDVVRRLVVLARTGRSPTAGRERSRGMPTADEVEVRTLHALARQVLLDAAHAVELVADRLPLLRAARRRAAALPGEAAVPEASVLDTLLSA